MRALATLAAIAALGVASASGAQCPTLSYCNSSYYQSCSFIPFPTDSLYAEQVWNPAPPGQPPLYQQIAAVAGDATRGMASAGASAWCYGEIEAHVGGMGIRMDDEFELVGPEPDVPITFTAVLRVVGHTRAGLYYFYHVGMLVCGAAGIKCVFGDELVPISREWREGPGCSDSYVDEDFSVPRTARPGVPFRLKHELFAGAYCGEYTAFDCSIHSRLRFDGLPAGYSIRSCHGFTTDTTTPTRRSSWAALKAHYR